MPVNIMKQYMYMALYQTLARLDKIMMLTLPMKQATVSGKRTRTVKIRLQMTFLLGDKIRLMTVCKHVCMCDWVERSTDDVRM